MRLGRDRETRALDLDRRAHPLDDLHVADAGSFPSTGAVDPTLTVTADALRVADVIERRLFA